MSIFGSIPTGGADKLAQLMLSVTNAAIAAKDAATPPPATNGPPVVNNDLQTGTWTPVIVTDGSESVEQPEEGFPLWTYSRNKNICTVSGSTRVVFTGPGYNYDSNSVHATLILNLPFEIDRVGDSDDVTDENDFRHCMGGIVNSYYAGVTYHGYATCFGDINTASDRQKVRLYFESSPPGAANSSFVFQYRCKKVLLV